jgi:hypothetical protein
MRRAEPGRCPGPAGPDERRARPRDHCRAGRRVDRSDRLGAVLRGRGAGSVIVIWRCTGARTLSETAEHRAKRAVAISFLLLAPYVAVESLRDLSTRQEPGSSVLGIVVTATSLIVIPVLRIAKRRLGRPPRLRGNRRRGNPEPAVRLPRRSRADRLDREQPARLLVARPDHRPGDSRRRSARGPRRLARRRLLLTVSATDLQAAPQPSIARTAVL